jgi:hypothetical protein
MKTMLYRPIRVGGRRKLKKNPLFWFQVMSDWLQNEALSDTNSSLPAKDDPKVTTMWSITVAIYCVGGMIGGVITGVVADR